MLLCVCVCVQSWDTNGCTQHDKLTYALCAARGAIKLADPATRDTLQVVSHSQIVYVYIDKDDKLEHVEVLIDRLQPLPVTMIAPDPEAPTVLFTSDVKPPKVGVGSDSNFELNHKMNVVLLESVGPIDIIKGQLRSTVRLRTREPEHCTANDAPSEMTDSNGDDVGRSSVASTSTHELHSTKISEMTCVSRLTQRWTKATGSR